MKKIFRLVLLALCCLLFTGCQTKDHYIGIWQTDIFDQGSVREDGAELAGEFAGGGMWNVFSSLLADQLHFNATLELRADGTATIDSGMEFSANWYVDGDHIVIEGDNIYGTATLSEDSNTLYFKNILSDEPEGNGVVIGQNYIEFEFKRLE